MHSRRFVSLGIAPILAVEAAITAPLLTLARMPWPTIPGHGLLPTVLLRPIPLAVAVLAVGYATVTLLGF